MVREYRQPRYTPRLSARHSQLHVLCRHRAAGGISDGPARTRSGVAARPLAPRPRRRRDDPGNSRRCPHCSNSFAISMRFSRTQCGAWHAPKSDSTQGKTPALSDAQVRKLLAGPQGDGRKARRDRAILAVLFFHALRRAGALCAQGEGHTRPARREALQGPRQRREAVTYFIETVLAKYVLKERVNWLRWVGASIVLCGVALVSL